MRPQQAAFLILSLLVSPNSKGRQSLVEASGTIFAILGIRAQTSCISYCPTGWKTLLGGGDHCYLMPPVPIPLMSFWDMQAFCKSQQPTAYIIDLNNMGENLGAGLAAL